MREEVLKWFLPKEIDTINDLSEEELDVYVEKYFEDHKAVIEKYFTWWDKRKLSNKTIFNYLSRKRGLDEDKGIFWVSSQLKYGKKCVFVPLNFYTLTEIVLSLDCRVEGIFRVRNSMITVKNCVEMLNKELQRRTPFDSIRNLLAENFNVIDLTTAFKEVVRNYKFTIIPENLLGIIYKVVESPNKSDTMILLHFFYISLPKYNRHTLEATIFFLYLIHDIATNKGENHSNNMNMEGISTVMMPNLLIKNSRDLELEKVSKLVKFMITLVNAFPTIVKKYPDF